MLLPLQGARLIALMPRVLPWARCFCPFRACGGKVSKVPLHRPCGTSRVSCRSFLLWISSLCSHLPAQNHNKNPRQGDNLLGDLLWSGPGNCGDFQFPSSGARWFRACRGLFLRPNCFVHWPNIHLGNWSQFCKLIFFIETYCAIIRGMPSSYSQEDATGISLVSSHRSYFFN